jgi:hypothetical protein
MSRGLRRNRTPITGRCLCGAVRYSVSGGPLPLTL